MLEVVFYRSHVITYKDDDTEGMEQAIKEFLSGNAKRQVTITWKKDKENAAT